MVDNQKKAAAVRRVLASSNAFEALDLAAEPIDESSARKKYRKLALLIHPDKCKLPDAAAAFRILTDAVDLLTCPHAQAELLFKLNATKNKDEASLPEKFWWEQKRKRDYGACEQQTKKRKKGRGQHKMTSYLDILEEQQEYEREFLKENEKKAKEFHERRMHQIARREKVRQRMRAHVKQVAQAMEKDVDKRASNWRSFIRAEASVDQSAAKTSPNNASTGHPPTAQKMKKRKPPLKHVCWICRRTFRSPEHLQKHRELSAIHLANLAQCKRDYCRSREQST